jgi:hypothetical protein
MVTESTTEYPLKTVQVIEKEHGVSRSRFMSMRPNAYVFDCETDDSECCTKALRLVSGSDSAIHPRDWNTNIPLNYVATDISNWVER